MVYGDCINKIIDSYKNILKDNLLGIYLHGSYVMGGFNPNVSDIDFLVVVKNDFSLIKKRALVEFLIKIEALAPAKGFEMSIVKLDITLNPSHPTPFLLHFSNYHKSDYIQNKDFICSGEDDPDLLAHMAVIENRGICVYGKAIDHVFGHVAKSYYIDAIMYDLDEVRTGIEENHDYYVLNLCRSLYYLKEGVVASKAEGGNWALGVLPHSLRGVANEALLKYIGLGYEWNFKDSKIEAFRDYMFEEIDEWVSK